MASGNLGHVTFPREPGRVTLERLEELHPALLHGAAHAPRHRVRARALRDARRRRARRATARTGSTRASIEGEDPLAAVRPQRRRPRAADRPLQHLPGHRR